MICPFIFFYTSSELGLHRKSPRFCELYTVEGRLTTFTQLQSLLNILVSDDCSSSVKVKEEVTFMADELVNFVINEHESSLLEKFSFLSEQLKLSVIKKKVYSASCILLAFRLFSTSKKAYDILRSELSLPHPKYLQKLSSVFSISSGLNVTDLQRCVVFRQTRRLSLMTS